MDSMVEIFAWHVQKQPGVLFVADSKGNEYTYSLAWKKIKQAAKYLSEEANIKKNDRVLVECNQDAEYLIVDMACELIGAIFVPIENNASLDRKQTICEETEAKLCISSSEPLGFVRSITFAEVLSSDKEIDLYEFPKAEQIGEILYTTGTTGKSKGIVITNKANVALAENIKYGVAMKPGSTEFIPVPISHSHGIRCCYANLLNGGTIVLSDGLMRIKQIFRMLDQYNVTAMDISPSAAQLLIKISKGAFWEYGKKMDYIQIGTAVLPEHLKEQLILELPGVHLYNFYGSTESGRSCVLDFSIDRGKNSCIGKATKNAEIVFTDEERNIIKATADNPGLLASRGAMNMLCYWKNQELTDKIMRYNFVYTNDLGYMDEDGYIFVFGRKDDVINYNGIKISPEEIEQVAIKYKNITDVACVPQPDSMAGQMPKLFIVVNDESSFDIKDYINYLTNHIDGNKMPKKISIIDKIPRTFNGKIKRKELIGL